MKKIIVIVIIVAIGWYGNYLYKQYGPAFVQGLPTDVVHKNEISSKENSRVPSFKCDGRIHCSQMKSCDEATFFLRNCPGVKMDGDNDGIPCENQWCG